MPAPLPLALLRRILYLRDRLRKSISSISRRLCVSRTTVRAALVRAARRQPPQLQGRRGRRQAGSSFARCGGYEVVADVLKRYEQSYLDEIAAEVARRTGKRFSLATISRAIARLGYTKKKVRCMSARVLRCAARSVCATGHLSALPRPSCSWSPERARQTGGSVPPSATRCAGCTAGTSSSGWTRPPRWVVAPDFGEGHACAEAEACVVLGAQDSRHDERTTGWAPKGQRTHSRTLFVRGLRYTAIVVMNACSVLDWYVVEGSACGEDMVNFAHESLVGAARVEAPTSFVLQLRATRAPAVCLPLQIPHLGPFPGPNSVVVMDNGRVHKDPDFLGAIHATGAIVEFLPPYSPQYNPVRKSAVLGVLALLASGGAAVVSACCPLPAADRAGLLQGQGMAAPARALGGRRGRLCGHRRGAAGCDQGGLPGLRAQIRQQLLHSGLNVPAVQGCV